MKVMEKIKKFWNETLGPDFPDEESAELNIDSSDPIIAELARSQKKVDEAVNKYGNSGKAQRKEMLKATKVEPKDLKRDNETAKKTSKRESVKENEDRELGE